jgi:hypothetical protein
LFALAGPEVRRHVEDDLDCVAVSIRVRERGTPGVRHHRFLIHSDLRARRPCWNPQTQFKTLRARKAQPDPDLAVLGIRGLLLDRNLLAVGAGARITDGP